jgi:hypothetical protein
MSWNNINLNLYSFQSTTIYNTQLDHIWTSINTTISFGLTKTHLTNHKPIYFAYKLPNFVCQFVHPNNYMSNHTLSTRWKNGGAHMFPKSCSSHVIVHYCELIFEELVIRCCYELLLWVFSLGTLFAGCNCEQRVHFLGILFFMRYCELLWAVSSFFGNLVHQVLLWTGSSVFRHFTEQIR